LRPDQVFGICLLGPKGIETKKHFGEIQKGGEKMALVAKKRGF
jgi:hypothetical protein